jgi:hypothetical protein
MFFTTEGVYKNGSIELAEKPDGVAYARVLVTFMTSETPSIPYRQMTYGQFAGDMMSADEDFRLAEWRGDFEDCRGES